MVSRASPMPAPQNPKPLEGMLGEVGEGFWATGRIPGGPPRVEWHQKSLAKLGRDQGGIQDGRGRSGVGRVGANLILNIPHPHHSPPLGATNGPNPAGGQEPNP